MNKYPQDTPINIIKYTLYPTTIKLEDYAMVSVNQTMCSLEQNSSVDLRHLYQSRTEQMEGEPIAIRERIGTIKITSFLSPFLTLTGNWEQKIPKHLSGNFPS